MFISDKISLLKKNKASILKTQKIFYNLYYCVTKFIDQAHYNIYVRKQDSKKLTTGFSTDVNFNRANKYRSQLFDLL